MIESLITEIRSLKQVIRTNGLTNSHLLNGLKNIGLTIYEQKGIIFGRLTKDTKSKLTHDWLDSTYFCLSKNIKIGSIEQVSNQLLRGLPITVINIFHNLSQDRHDDGISEKEIQFREMIFNNIHPQGYDLHDKIMGIYKDLKSFHPDNEEYYSNMKNKIRADLFRKYLGLNQLFDSIIIQDLKIRPRLEADPCSIYYDFSPVIKSHSLQGIKQYCNSFDDLIEYIVLHKAFPGSDFTRLEAPDNIYRNEIFSQLGKYGTGVSKGFNPNSGEIERYISYYDLRDLDPLKNNSTLDIDKFNFPFEIYGRVYESDFNKL